MSGCVFCAIVAGEQPAHVVLDDDRFLAFLDVRPLFHGHTLLVPRGHHETLADLPAEDVGQGPILIYPYNRDKFKNALFRVPDGRHLIAFGLLRNAVPPTPERAAGLVADNRALFERATELGGKRYPFDSVPMTKHDWQKRYQPVWGQFVSAKQTYDPDGILTPGQGIF